MNGNSSTDRTVADLILFGMGFVGFVTGAGGLVLQAPGVALFGGALILLALVCFFLKS